MRRCKEEVNLKSKSEIEEKKEGNVTVLIERVEGQKSSWETNKKDRQQRHAEKQRKKQRKKKRKEEESEGDSLL